MIMCKTYKYWLYYYDDELYAYTDNKSYAKSFERDRDMNKFIKRKKEITREDVNMLAREEQDKYLLSNKIDIYNKEKMTWFEAEFVMTQMERTTINNIAVQVMNEDLYKYCWNTPFIFNNKIIKALELLQYNTLHRQLTYSTRSGEYPAEFCDEIIHIKPDMLGIFLHYFGKTMKGD